MSSGCESVECTTHPVFAVYLYNIGISYNIHSTIYYILQLTRGYTIYFIVTVSDILILSARVNERRVTKYYYPHLCSFDKEQKKKKKKRFLQHGFDEEFDEH